MKSKVVVSGDYDKYLQDQIRQSAETRKYPEYMRRCRHAILECMQQWKPYSSVLEIGCGDGFSLDFMKEYEFDCAGVDVSPDKIKSAAQQGHRVYCIDAIELPFVENQFDVVYCRHTLEHILKLDETLDEIARVLKPDGLFSVIVPVVLESQLGSKHVQVIPNKEFIGELLQRHGFVILENQQRDMPGGLEVWALAQNKKDVP